jgi:Holliday junction resolvase-like predicted endonuclease
MKKQKTLVVLEVKFRKQLDDLTTLVPKKKIEALIRGINCFLAFEVHEHDTIRIDLAVVTLNNGRLRLAHYLPNIAPE